MIRALALLALLSGCASTQAPAPATPPEIPLELQSCPTGTMAPPAPTLRTAVTLAKWSIQIELANEANENALITCAVHLGRVLAIVGVGQ